MATITWQGNGGTILLPKTGGWFNIANWDLGRIPALDDDVVLGGTGTYTSNIGVNISVDSVSISDPAATLAIRAGVTLTITGTDATALDSSGTITLGTTGTGGGPGTINDSGGLLGTVVGFGSITAAEFGGTIKASGGRLVSPSGSGRFRPVTASPLPARWPTQAARSEPVAGRSL